VDSDQHAVFSFLFSLLTTRHSTLITLSLLYRYVGNPHLRAAVFAEDGPFLDDGLFTDRALTDELRATVFAELFIVIIGLISAFGAYEIAFHKDGSQ
jgi:hypothetical protein